MAKVIVNLIMCCHSDGTHLVITVCEFNFLICNQANSQRIH